MLRWRARPTILALLLVAIVAMAAWFWSPARRWRSAAAELDYANLAPGVAYVGSDACTECHRTISSSYARTAMGRSWQEPARAEPIENYESPNIVEDTVLGFKYRVFAQDGRFYQEEFREGETGNKTHSLVREIRYAVGSGTHGRSYLAQHNGFLTVLPLGWYSADAIWDLGPSYRQRNRRFDREVPVACTSCHNSYPNFVPGSVNRYEQPLPLGIGCERCHGPGELHVNYQRARSASLATAAAAGPRDRTIVNPRHLPIDRRDDVCFQCHLESDVAFPARDKDWMDYRPGLRLGDYRRDFFVAPEDPTSFVFASHAPRMRNSACWSRGDPQHRMTCTSCHDPHVPLEEVKPEHYVQKCLECHAATECSRPPESLRPGSHDCIGCHMPKAPPSNVAHAVFTEHWIRKRAELSPPAPTGIRMHDPSKPLDFIDFWSAEAPAPAAEHAIARARFLDAAGWKGRNELERAVRELSEAARQQHDDPDVQFWLGAMYEMLQAPRQAAAAYERAARLRPGDPLVQNSLGVVYHRIGRTKDAVKALERAIETCPDYLANYNDLAALHSSRRNWAAALGALDQALERYPYLSDELAFRAELLLASSGPSDATIAAIKKSRALDPDRVQTVLLWSNVQLAQGMTNDAISTLQSAQRRQPKSVPVLLALGSLLTKQGRYDEAEQLLERLRELEPKHPAIPQIERELSQLRTRFSR